MVSSGDYKIGAVCSFCLSFFPVLKDPPYIQNSANIIVQESELNHGSVRGGKDARLGIRLLYKGATNRMEGGRGIFFALALSVSDTD
jgi:hypothetical protein